MHVADRRLGLGPLPPLVQQRAELPVQGRPYTEGGGQGLCVHQVGRLSLQLSAAGDHTTALTALDRAREAFLSLGDARMAARSLADTGRVLARTGTRAEAAAALSRAADDLHEVGASHYEARALEDLAELLDEPERIRRCLRRALAVYEEGGSPRAAVVLARLTDG